MGIFKKDTLNKPYDPLNKDIDLKWAGNSYDADTKFNNYYDYYFSGEDIKVFIDGLFGPEDEMDLANFAYSVKQEKQPLYGFWSYNYDAVMRGTRLITGEFTIFTRHPRRMTEFLEKAALARATNPSSRNARNSIISKLSNSTEDEKNIQKYWAYSQLDRLTQDPAGAQSEKNIFSAHPPFNFVILFGVEETAISPINAVKRDTYDIDTNLDRMIYSDVNQRSVKLENLVSPMKTIIQQVELVNMTTTFGPGGQPVAESYQFFARDYYLTEADLSFIKKLPAYDMSDSDSTRATGTSSTNTGLGGGGRK